MTLDILRIVLICYIFAKDMVNEVALLDVLTKCGGKNKELIFFVLQTLLMDGP